MKKIMIIAAAIGLFAACSNKDFDVLPDPTEGIPVRLTFGDAGNFSRAFFDNTVAAEPWEKAIHNMTVYAFNSEGKLVMRKQFSADDIQNMRADFVIHGVIAGETINFYAMANRTSFYETMTEDNILSNMETNPSAYNNDFATVTTSQPRINGFEFNGRTTATINTDGSVNNISLTLKRLVAKIALKIDVDPGFSQRYFGGAIKVTSVMIESPAWSTKWFYDGYTVRPSTATMKYTQLSGLVDGAYCNLFYVFEQGAPAYSETEKTKLHITALFDQDANYSTAGDQIYFRYTLEINGSGGGEIRRNGYYRITATIKDVDALQVNSAMEVSEWESPSTEDAGEIDMN